MINNLILKGLFFFVLGCFSSLGTAEPGNCQATDTECQEAAQAYQNVRVDFDKIVQDQDKARSSYTTALQPPGQCPMTADVLDSQGTIVPCIQ